MVDTDSEVATKSTTEVAIITTTTIAEDREAVVENGTTTGTTGF